MRQTNGNFFLNIIKKYFHNKAIKRTHENSNLFLDGKIPTAQQLNNKIVHVRLTQNKSQ